jgi:hypothetical protein
MDWFNWTNFDGQNLPWVKISTSDADAETTKSPYNVYLSPSYRFGAYRRKRSCGGWLSQVVTIDAIPTSAEPARADNADK